MDKLVIASMRKSAGKTAFIIGLSRVLGKRFGYVKPFGDRLVYLKKRLWDYDAALVTHIFGLHENPEDMSIGFDHAKLRYMYDEMATKEKIREMISRVEGPRDMFFVEGGMSMSYGASVYLDSLSLTRHIDGGMVMVMGGDEATIMDDLVHLKRNIRTSGIDLKGIIINKVTDLDDFQEVYLPDIESLGINVLGMIPKQPELTRFSINYLARTMFAKVIAGEGGLNRTIENIFVGAMSVNSALRNPLFSKEKKLIITSGDRSDMILAAMDNNTECIILSNNILPASSIISKASDNDIPLLLVPQDTYNIAMQINGMEPLITKEDTSKIELLETMVREHVGVNEFT